MFCGKSISGNQKDYGKLLTVCFQELINFVYANINIFMAHVVNNKAIEF